MKNIYHHKIKEKQVEAFLLRKELELRITEQSMIKHHLRKCKDSALILPSYFNNAMDAIKNLDRTILMINEKITSITNEIREMFIEKKKLEIYYTSLHKKKLLAFKMKEKGLTDELAARYSIPHDPL